MFNFCNIDFRLSDWEGAIPGLDISNLEPLLGGIVTHLSEQVINNQVVKDTQSYLLGEANRVAAYDITEHLLFAFDHCENDVQKFHTSVLLAALSHIRTYDSSYVLTVVNFVKSNADYQYANLDEIFDDDGLLSIYAATLTNLLQGDYKISETSLTIPQASRLPINFAPPIYKAARPDSQVYTYQAPPELISILQSPIAIFRSDNLNIITDTDDPDTVTPEQVSEVVLETTFRELRKDHQFLFKKIRLDRDLKPGDLVLVEVVPTESVPISKLYAMNIITCGKPTPSETHECVCSQPSYSKALPTHEELRDVSSIIPIYFTDLSTKFGTQAYLKNLYTLEQPAYEHLHEPTDITSYSGSDLPDPITLSYSGTPQVTDDGGYWTGLLDSLGIDFSTDFAYDDFAAALQSAADASWSHKDEPPTLPMFGAKKAVDDFVTASAYQFTPISPDGYTRKNYLLFTKGLPEELVRYIFVNTLVHADKKLQSALGFSPSTLDYEGLGNTLYYSLEHKLDQFYAATFTRLLCIGAQPGSYFDTAVAQKILSSSYSGNEFIRLFFSVALVYFITEAETRYVSKIKQGDCSPPAKEHHFGANRVSGSSIYQLMSSLGLDVTTLQYSYGPTNLLAFYYQAPYTAHWLGVSYSWYKRNRTSLSGEIGKFWSRIATSDEVIRAGGSSTTYNPLFVPPLNIFEGHTLHDYFMHPTVVAPIIINRLINTMKDLSNPAAMNRAIYFLADNVTHSVVKDCVRAGGMDDSALETKLKTLSRRVFGTEHNYLHNFVTVTKSFQLGTGQVQPSFILALLCDAFNLLGHDITEHILSLWDSHEAEINDAWGQFFSLPDGWDGYA